MKFQIFGTNNVIGNLTAIQAGILAGANKGVMTAANFMKSEVKASIDGNRAEPKSVDTGRFLKSIKANRVSDNSAQVATDTPYAIYLENGTIKMAPRRHFSNSLARNKQKITDTIKNNVKTALSI